MKLETVQKKVAAILTARQNGEYRPVQFVGYKKSLGTFGSANWSLNLVDMRGYSYRWWSMFEVIKGRNVLNTYRYSPSTGNHIRKASMILAALGVKFIRVEAPQGLQDLDSAHTRALQLYGKAMVERKYARKPNPWAVTHALRNMASCGKLGLKFTRKEMQAAILDAENNRRASLERNKVAKQQQQLQAVRPALEDILTGT